MKFERFFSKKNCFMKKTAIGLFMFCGNQSYETLFIDEKTIYYFVISFFVVGL